MKWRNISKLNCCDMNSFTPFANLRLFSGSSGVTSVRHLRMRWWNMVRWVRRGYQQDEVRALAVDVGLERVAGEDLDADLVGDAEERDLFCGRLVEDFFDLLEYAQLAQVEQCLFDGLVVGVFDHAQVFGREDHSVHAAHVEHHLHEDLLALRLLAHFFIESLVADQVPVLFFYPLVVVRIEDVEEELVLAYLLLPPDQVGRLREGLQLLQVFEVFLQLRAHGFGLLSHELHSLFERVLLEQLDALGLDVGGDGFVLLELPAERDAGSGVVLFEPQLLGLGWVSGSYA